MTEIEPVSKNNNDEYYSIEEDGVMRCSCGRELITLDENTYKCSGGFPIYRFDEGSVFLDKFGNLCIKKLSHAQDGKK